MIVFSQIAKGNIFGFSVAMATVKKVAISVMNQALEANHSYLVSFADVHILSRAAHESEYGDNLRAYDLICPDAMMLVWSLRERRDPAAKRTHRITGTDTFLEIMGLTDRLGGTKHFFLGGSPNMLEALVSRVGESFPSAEIVGSSPTPEDLKNRESNWALAQEIQTSGANIIWVGIGSPEQEVWLAQNAHVLPPGVYLTVGPTFSYISGLSKRTPKWMRRLGMEWVYRMVQEPRLIMKRYFVWNFLYVIHSIFGGKKKDG